jgi:hypothetical protein
VSCTSLSKLRKNAGSKPFCKAKMTFLHPIVMGRVAYHIMSTTGDALTHDFLAPNSLVPQIEGFDNNSLWASSKRLMLQNLFIIAYWRK